ncbi:MAG: hypothetical protein WC533_00880 [Candidatus Pacearchaeota archaeon]
MVRHDIVSALKNSVERGEDLERAKQVLISSGYSVRDVNEAANYLTGGLAGEIKVQQKQATYQQIIPQKAPNFSPPNIYKSDSETQNYESSRQGQQIPQLISQKAAPQQQKIQALPFVESQHLPRMPEVEYKVKKDNKKLFVIALLIIFLVLLITSLVLVILFKEDVIAFIQGLLG